MTAQIKKTLRIQATIGWYLLCCVAILALKASGGECVRGGIVYCYGDTRDLWWHPTNLIGSLFFGLLIPLPHILIAMLYKSKRNLACILEINEKWHSGAVLLITVGLALEYFLLDEIGKSIDKKINYVSEPARNGEYQKTDAERINSPLELNKREMALSLALECASFKKKLGNYDDAVKLNGYVIFQLTESKIDQESSQKMIFSSIGKVNAFYAENYQDLLSMKRMEGKVCSSAKAQLPDFPSSLWKHKA